MRISRAREQATQWPTPIIRTDRRESGKRNPITPVARADRRLPGYATASPVNAHRRASGNKPTSTPPASAAAATNPSPGARFYPNQQGTPDPNQNAMSAQSPYQPNSAPPQVAGHQANSQPQTAHPYGGGYYNYYDHQQGQWPQQHYQQQGSFSQPTRASAPSTTPQTAVPSETPGQPPQHRSSQSGAPYDYSQYQGYNGGGHERAASAPHTQHWQTPVTASNRYSMSGQGAPQSQQWQGYPPHPMQQSMHPQHMQMQGQYAGWQQQQWNAQGYYPPVTPNSANPSAPLTHAKKDSKDYDGLGKRTVESGTEDEADDGKKKKGKKEKEKEKEEVVPKPPAKSHLHPPRQAQSMWQLFFTDELNKAKAAAASGDSPGGTPHHAKLNVAQIAKDAGIAYANLTPSQKQYYTDKVQESKDQYAKDLSAWQATLTPEDIRVENAFRAQQRKEGKSRKGNLKDPNAPKKPLSAYFLFLKGIREDDALRARVWGEESETTKQSVLAAERWRSLTDDEKRVSRESRLARHADGSHSCNRPKRTSKTMKLRARYMKKTPRRGRGARTCPCGYIPKRPSMFPNLSSKNPNRPRHNRYSPSRQRLRYQKPNQAGQKRPCSARMPTM